MRLAIHHAVRGRRLNVKRTLSALYCFTALLLYCFTALLLYCFKRIVIYKRAKQPR